MKPEFWLERWERHQIGFHQPKFNKWLVKYVGSLELKPGDAVFVPLCGKSLDMVFLASLGAHVVGVELSELAVQEFFAEQDVAPVRSKVAEFEAYSYDNITLLTGDFFAVTTWDIQDAHASYDRGSLVALPPEMRERYAHHMSELIPPGGRVLLLTFEYAEGAREGPPFLVKEGEVRRLYELTFDVRLLESVSEGVAGMGEKIFLLTRL